MAAGQPDDEQPVGDDELTALFHPFESHAAVVLAVSGGPDSSALMLLAARWRANRPDGPALLVVTVDHRLRPASAIEAAAVAERAQAIGLPHRTLPWTDPKPASGIQEAARDARYRLLAEAAAEAGATAIAVAHTQDDQAETVLFRLARGSGLQGLAGMRGQSERQGYALLRPLLDVPKARLVATLEAAGLGFVRDPSNFDLRFARPRLRTMAPALAREGLDARRLAILARRSARADAALEAATDAAEAALGGLPEANGSVLLPVAPFLALPDEIALRLLGRAVAHAGTEGPVELAKLEALLVATRAAAETRSASFRRTLAGALVGLTGAGLRISPAPARRPSAPSR